MYECAFCGSADVELVTTSFEEQEGGVTIRIDGVPAVRCLSCEEGGESAVTLGVAKALESAYDGIFEATADSLPILTGVAGPDAERKAV